MAKLQRLNCLFCAVSLLSAVLCFERQGFNAFPVKVGEISIDKKPFLGGLALAGLALGKRLIDGPMFSENVSLSGRNVVITGGNTGLGKETAVKLASLGARTIILCRNVNKASAAVAEIQQRSGSKLVSAVEIDLADLNSIDKCANQLKKELRGIDVLVNNAGVMAIPQREVTKDGFEKHLGINHLGHFALTNLLMDLIRQDSGNGNTLKRIVNISSAAHLLGKIDETDLMLDKTADSYEPWHAYGNSKLANILFTKEMARRVKAKYSDSPTDVITVCCHPGGCRTELGRYLFDPNKDSIPIYAYPLVAVAGPPLVYMTKSAEQGAQTQIFLSASEKISKKDSGSYYDNSAVADTNTESKSIEEAAWLWQESERLIGKTFSV